MQSKKLCPKKEEWFFENYKKESIFLFGPTKVNEFEILEFARRYDPQLFHTDRNFAKNGPFKGLIASGWQTCGFVMRLLVDNYFSNVSSLGSPGVDELRWIIPVRPDDEITVRVTVVEAKKSRSRPDRGIVKTFVEAINQDKKIVMSFYTVNFILCRESLSI